MSATLLQFPDRGPFTVSVTRESAAWLVTCREHGWLHGDERSAVNDALDIARGFGVAARYSSSNIVIKQSGGKR